VKNMNPIASRILVGVVVAVSLVLGGCARKPEKELQDARDAIKELEDAGAPQYIPDDWNRINASLKEAETKIDEKKYKEARELLLKIVEEANLLKSKAEEEAKRQEEQQQQEQQQEEQQAPEAVTPPDDTEETQQ
jgi:Fe2+ transport system protein B